MLKFRNFKPRRSLIIAASILIVGLVGVFGYKLFTENKLTRFDIDAQNINCTTNDEIKSFLLGLNLSYFYFKKAPVENQIKQKFFCIGKIESEIFYPDRLKLKMNGRDAKFVIKSVETAINTNPSIELNMDQLNATQSTTEAFPPKVLNQILKTYQQSSASAMFLVDEEGMIFQETSSDVDFPKLSFFSQDLRMGTRLPDNLIKKVSDLSVKLKELDSFSDNLLIVGDKLIVDSKPRLTFSLERPLDRQSASLQLILRQAKMNLDPASGDIRPIESIDLRFDRPVIVYGKK